MKRTTYLFIAVIVLFIAAYHTFQHIEATKARSKAQASTAAMTSTPFVIQNINEMYEDQTLYKLYMYKYNGFMESYMSSSSRDSVWTGELSGDSLCFFSLNLRIATTRKNISFVNDGVPIVYDEQTDSLLEGSELNRRFVAMQKAERTFEQHNYRVPDSYTSLKMTAMSTKEKEELMKKCEDGFAHLEVFRKTIKEFCQNNKDNVLPAYFIAKYARLFSSTAAEGLIDRQAAYMEHPLMEDNVIYQMLCRYPQGTPFADLELYTTKGEEVKLSQWAGKGHYTLAAINHEGSLEDMLFTQKAYDKYHAAKGLQVINIFTHRRYDDWKYLIDDMNMPWICLASFDHTPQLTDSYGISSDKPLMLIDPEGKIVDFNIHDVEIEKTLKAVYGE